MTLAQACSIGGGGIQTGPFGSQLHAKDYVLEGVPSIMPQNIGDNRVVPDGIAKISADDATRLGRYLVKTGDIVYSRRGDVEKRALIRETEEGWLCGTGCLRVRLGDSGPDPVYASYYLGHPVVRAWVVRHAHGATMPNLNTTILGSLPFVVPPRRAQEAIADVLGALDDKIALNRRMSETLEAIASAVFRHWFVDFSGVEEFEDSALGPVPRGWGVFPVGDAVEVVGGSTPSTKESRYWESGTYAWATPKDLSGLSTPVLLATSRRITDSGLRTISSGLLPPGTLLLSSRAPIGYTAITQISVAVNQGFIAIPPGGLLPTSYMLFWTRSNLDAIKGRSGGTTFPEISKRAFRPLPIIVPPKDRLQAFTTVAEPVLLRITACEEESATLATIRDTLLPKLISGELRIPEAERLVSEVT